MHFSSLCRDYDSCNYTAVKGKRPKILLVRMWENINALYEQNASLNVNSDKFIAVFERVNAVPRNGTHPNYKHVFHCATMQ
jgi:hypothetical protein